MNFTGRRVIYSDETEVTESNITSILDKAYGVHTGNRSEIIYLDNYRRGLQPIIYKQAVSENRANNIVIENRAAEIVNFKVSYLLGEPIQYVSRTDSKVSKALNQLNDYVFAEDKASKDKELAEWFYTCGTSYRMILPDEKGDIDESPFEVYTLDPRNTFVVYQNSIDKKPLLGVTYIVKENGGIRFTCYSETDVYYVEWNEHTKKYNVDTNKGTPNGLGAIPIIEYPANNSRMGAFEVVLTMLDAINQIDSDRVDAIQNFVEALMIYKNVDIDQETFSQIKEIGGIKVPVDGDVSYLVQELSQDSVQTLSNNMYETVLEIVGMPSTSSGNTSDSSNNGAVILKNGWYGAESLAKDTELIFKKSEKQFLKLALEIIKTMSDASKKKFKLELKDVDIRFTRRNYEDLLVKSQTLVTLLATEKVHPKLCFEACNMFPDSELAYTMSEEYIKSIEDKQNESLNNFKTYSIHNNIYQRSNRQANVQPDVQPEV